jgi:hypothetical protein
MRSSLVPVRVAVAAGLGTGLLLAGGVGAAAAGVLPGAAQDTARTWLDTVGVEVPGPDEHSAGHADQRGRSAENGPVEEPVGEPAPVEQTAPAEATAPDAAAEPEKELPTASEHGQTVSETARETELEGAEKGALVSETARSRSQADEESAPETAPEETEPQESAQPEGSSTDGGAGRPADTQDAGAAGKAKADEASGGRRHDGGDRNP